jgi:hypothetical protein
MSIHNSDYGTSSTKATNLSTPGAPAGRAAAVFATPVRMPAPPGACNTILWTGGVFDDELFPGNSGDTYFLRSQIEYGDAE